MASKSLTKTGTRARPRRAGGSLVVGDGADHAHRLIYQVCCLAGSTNLLEDLRDAETGLPAIVSRRDTPALFDWWVSALSYQGISDAVAYEYMRKHGRVTWRGLIRDFASRPRCPKLQSYWHYSSCRYDKGSNTCAEPDHVRRCPLPQHHLRNGRLNQTAYSLYLFIRDIADNDLVGWIDGRLAVAATTPVADRRHAMQQALIGPLRNVFGVSDKVLTMTLSAILISAPNTWPHWSAVGCSLIAVDTLVHNFMARTGILRRLGADHAYGAACYQPGRCAQIIEAAAAKIDATKFNPTYPADFPRFVQHAIWRYCAQQGLDVCNGNRIDDRKKCTSIQCRMFMICDHVSLKNTQ